MQTRVLLRIVIYTTFFPHIISEECPNNSELSQTIAQWWNVFLVELGSPVWVRLTMSVFGSLMRIWTFHSMRFDTSCHLKTTRDMLELFGTDTRLNYCIVIRKHLKRESSPLITSPWKWLFALQLAIFEQIYACPMLQNWDMFLSTSHYFLTRTQTNMRTSTIHVISMGRRLYCPWSMISG